MKLKRNIKGTSEISMASSSDIAFLLIIFFMITSAFIFKDGLHLVLPDKSKKPKVVMNEEIATIILSSNGNVTLNGKKIADNKIKIQLEEMIRKDKELIVLLKIGNDVVYQRAIDIIDIIKFSGAKKLSLRMI